MGVYNEINEVSCIQNSGLINIFCVHVPKSSEN